MNERTRDFSAVINKVGINPFIDVPEHVSAFFGKRSYVPVSGTLNGVAIRATLVPVGKGRHRLYINDEMRKKANVTVGDRIRLSLSIDTEPREAPMPKEFAEALKKSEKARMVFENLSPSRQREILVYLNYLKKPESLRRNIEKVIRLLAEPEGKTG
jgi:hypothetical protein